MNKLIIFFLLLLSTSARAQFGGVPSTIYDPVDWSFRAEAVAGNEFDILITAEIEPGWHVYSQFIEGDGGPIPTNFSFEPSKNYRLIGSVSETPKAVVGYDKTFDMNIAWHKDKVVFRQRIVRNSPDAVVKGKLEFMVCNAERCLPPEEVEFSIPLQGVTPATVVAPAGDSVSLTNADTASVIGTPGSQNVTVSQAAAPAPGAGSLWGIFFAGFIGGLAAFFMPCIYPMIPLTVSFFTKKAGSRARGIRLAAFYGLSIIVIYVALGLLVTVIFGASALNEAASSAVFNLIFFAALIVFGVSFLGAFDINLPSSIVNRMDERSNQGGFAGIFFMAFTLALVSFSCTGPIIGTLLVDAVSKGTYLGPAAGMLGFALALAIPFTLFAIFPAWLKEMPKSGGWLNTVKVSLGFLEIALAFKFLSNVDLAYHWNLLDRDVFLVIWIVVFGFWALYLMGGFRLSHDAASSHIGLPRLFFAMLVAGFTIYMVPGLWGAPLKGISAWLPPQTTQDFDLYSKTFVSGTDAGQTSGKKYAGLFHAPHGLDAFYDYEEGLAYAKQVNKPVLIDFTGWSCVNCRKMEASVWPDPEVLKRLKENYVLISLYVDDKTKLADDEQYVSAFSGKKIRTIGQKWSDFQASRFGTNSQPYYVITSTNGTVLVPPQAFNLDIQNYINFLDSGIAAFETN